MRCKGVLRVLVSLSALALAACSSSSSGGGSGGGGEEGDAAGDAAGGDTMIGGLDVAATCASFAAVRCNILQECAPFILSMSWSDISDCEADLATVCEGTLGADGAMITSETADGCIDALEDSSCDDVLGGANIENCEIPGSRENGEPCGVREQCQSLYCPTDEDDCGICTANPEAGADCVDGDCGRAGLYCDDDDVCVARVAEDGDCSGGALCEGRLACVGGDEDATCQPSAGDGEACSSDRTEGPPCDFAEGLFCNPLTDLCEQLLTAVESEDCGVIGTPPDLTFVFCIAGSLCDAIPPDSGTCVALPVLGESCSEEEICLGPLQCIDGECGYVDPNACD
jgi:hypothetical protein